MSEAAPEIVTLCGSTKFKDAFIRAAFEETMAGRMVFTVGFFSHADEEGYQPTRAEKCMLDALHLRKIERSQSILVIDEQWWRCPDCKAWHTRRKTHVGTYHSPTCVCHVGLPGWTAVPFELAAYIGASTSREIAHALDKKVRVRYRSKEINGTA